MFALSLLHFPHSFMKFCSITNLHVIPQNYFVYLLLLTFHGKEVVLHFISVGQKLFYLLTLETDNVWIWNVTEFINPLSVNFTIHSVSSHRPCHTFFSWGLIKNNSLKNQDNAFLVLLLPWILWPLWSYSDIVLLSKGEVSLWSQSACMCGE